MAFNFFDTYYMAGMVREIVPKHTFFRDRYFPTNASTDIFKANKVLVEYKDGDRKLAPFVVQRVGDIPIARGGYQVHEFEPAYIAPSRILTLDDLNKRGYGEALYTDRTPAERARALQLEDLTDLDTRIVHREEWMAVQTMINNGCTMHAYIDDSTVGEVNDVFFYDTAESNPALYTVGNPWNSAEGDFFGDVKVMCRMLSKRGLRAADLILGTDVSDYILDIEKVQKLLNKDSGIIIGQIEEELSEYDGIVFMGRLNFGGVKLNLISVDETYIDTDGTEKPFFPTNAAMVTAPGCGHMMYGQITQMEPDNEYHTFAMQRVPKLIVNEDVDMRKLRLASRPLAAPLHKAPWIYAPQVVQ